MGVSRLSGRLARIRDNRMPASGKWQTETETEAVILPGWELTAPYLYERLSLVPVSGVRNDFSAHLPLLFPREQSEVRSLIQSAEANGALVFFDLETTGLSHGAGTVAFMAGIARFAATGKSGQKNKTDDTLNLEIRQILLADYPGEGAFLSRFVELVGDDPVFVSFNGKCFDSQILATRFSMNSFRPAFMKKKSLHLDLLFPSRRLWKARLGSCRLSVIEERILGIQRIDDLPGSEAPDAWFDFLKAGKIDRLLAIGEHNRDDCASLAKLLYALDGAIDSGAERAALVRALHLRSLKDYEASARLLGPLAAAGDPVALRLLAVDSEHRIKDLERALWCAERLGDENRLKRIRNKIDKKTL